MYRRGCTLDKTVIILCNYGQAFGESIGCRRCPALCFVSLQQTKSKKPEISALQFFMQRLNKLKFREPCIQPALAEQGLMRSLFNHCAIFKYDDVIRTHHCRKTMGNCQRGSAWQHTI